MDQGSRCVTCGHPIALHGATMCYYPNCKCNHFTTKVEGQPVITVQFEAEESWCDRVTDDAIRTDLDTQMYPNVTLRLTDPKTLQSLHNIMRVYVIAGEALDNLKKALFYGKPMPSDPTVEPYPSPEPLEKLADYNTMRLLHAAIGMGTEAAEILDAMHKHIFQGEPLDYANLEEEYGDSSWYMRLAATALRKFTGGGLYQIIVRNIAKLKKRYPDKFTAEAALNRDLDSERKIFDQRV